MNVSTQAPNLDAMTRRTPPEGLSPDERRRWNEAHKNRNRHSVKFPDDLEADYQAWKNWWGLNDNAAIKYLVESPPDLYLTPKNKP